MVHYGFNLGSPAANIAPERTGGRYATRHAGQEARSIGAGARQPKARLKWSGSGGSALRPPRARRPSHDVVTPSSNRNATLGIHRDSRLW
jgi:hypothetical protein